MLFSLYTPMKIASSIQQNVDSLPLSDKKTKPQTSVVSKRIYFNNMIKLKVL